MENSKNKLKNWKKITRIYKVLMKNQNKSLTTLKKLILNKKLPKITLNINIKTKNKNIKNNNKNQNRKSKILLQIA